MAFAAWSRSSAPSLIALADRAVADMLVDAVGHQHESVALLDPERQVIDLDLRIYAERAAEIALLRRDDDAMIVGQLLERVAGKTIDPAIADVKDMRGGRLDDHGAQRADVAPVLVVGILAAPRLRVQPGIGRLQHALRRGPHRPGFRGAVIVGQKALDRRLGCDPADLAAADAVRQHDGDALQARAAARSESERRENPDWSPCDLCQNVARPIFSVRAASFTTSEQGLDLDGRDPLKSIAGQAATRAATRFGAVLTCVAYSVRPVKARPPTRLPTTVGISFQIR